MIWIVVLLCVQVALNQQAIILSSSIGFYNYRQTANAVQIYQYLKNNGFTDDKILLFLGEISACCEKNPKYGTLSFYDGQYENTFSDAQVDYYFLEMQAKGVSNIFSNHYPEFMLNKQKLQLKASEPLFIFVTGHGGDYYFKIRERQALIDEQFNYIFDDLISQNLTESVVLLSDSCSAITPFEQVEAKKFLAFASSSFDEKSLSHGHDYQLNSPKSDDFTFYLDEYLKNYQNKRTFRDLQKYMDFQKLKVNAKIISNGISKSQSLDKYIQRKKEGQTKKYKTKIKLTDIL